MNAALDAWCAILQELLHLDAVLAESALVHFQSCVRTTLLLCDGYECQEKVSHTLCLHACEGSKYGSSKV